MICVFNVFCTVCVLCEDEDSISVIFAVVVLITKSCVTLL